MVVKPDDFESTAYAISPLRQEVSWGSIILHILPREREQVLRKATKQKSQAKREQEKAPRPLGRTRLKTYHCLLTGFNAFGQFKANPTEELVKSMPAFLTREGAEGEIFKLIFHPLLLPTSGRKAQLLLTKAFKSLKKLKGDKSFLLLTGQAIPTENLRLERLALNFKDYRIPDNDGELACDQAIDAKGPGLLKTSVNLLALKDFLQKAGWPIEISNHAGTFICNEVYYRALRLKGQTHSSCPVLFLHTPDLAVLAQNTSAEKKALLQGLAVNDELENLYLLRQVCNEILDFLIQNS